MKNLTIIILTIFVFSAYGQESSTIDFKRVQIGIIVSPDICFRTLKNNDGSPISDLTLTYRNNRETIKIGYTAGLNACFNFKNIIGLETGVQYSNKGYQTKIEKITLGQPDPSLPEKFKYIYDYHYIDIPVKANFTIGKKKVRYFTSIGVTTNILIKYTEIFILVYSDHTNRETNSTSYNYNKVNISPTISVGIDYKINNRMNLRVEPTFRFGVLKIIDAPVTGYLYNGGFNISYYFGL